MCVCVWVCISSLLSEREKLLLCVILCVLSVVENGASGNGGASGDGREASNSRRGNKNYYRHSTEQIRRLEE